MILYKYVSSERINILQDSMVRFTPFNSLNDPFELSFHLKASREAMINYYLGSDEKIKKYIDEVVKVNPNLGTLKKKNTKEQKEALELSYKDEYFYEAFPWDKILKNIIDKVSAKVGILSLCENKDSLLMWSHYAQEHRGLVIGFDTDVLTRHFNSSPVKVIYKDEKIEACITDMDKVENSPHFLNQLKKACFIKSSQWSYEKEWRYGAEFIHWENETDIIGLRRFPSEAIAEIIIGLDGSDELKHKIKNIMSINALKHVKLFETKMSLSEYQLKFSLVGSG